jgi:uncharacterized protein YdgA (DUF945 family)
MKRALLIVVIVIGVLAVALAAAPFWLGMQTEAAFNDAMKIAASRGGMPSRSSEFSRGWLSSKARNIFTLPGSPVVINAAHHIEHGPFPLTQLMAGDIAPSMARIESTVTLMADKKAPSEVVDIINSLPPVTLLTTFDLSGDGSSDINIAAGTRKMGKESLKWSPGSGSIRFDKGLKKIQTSFTLPSMVFNTKQGAFNISSVSLNSDVYEGTAGYMFGRNSVSIKKIAMKPFFDMTGLSLGATIQPKGKFANLTINYGLKKMTLAKDSYGPGDLTIAIRNLDAATMKRFEDELNKIYARGLPEEQAQLMIAGKVMEFAGKLTRENPEIEVTKLSFRAPGGELKGKAKFVVQGKEQDLSANPMLILTAIKGSAEMTMPESLAKALVMPQIQRDLALLQQEGKLSRNEASELTPEIIDQIAEDAYPGYLKESGFGRWFVRNNSEYRFTLSVDRGLVVVNGIPITGGPR